MNAPANWTALTAGLILPFLGAVFVTIWSMVGGIYAGAPGLFVGAARFLSLGLSVIVLALGVALNMMAVGMGGADRVLRYAAIGAAICIAALPFAYLV